MTEVEQLKERVGELERQLTLTTRKLVEARGAMYRIGVEVDLVMSEEAPKISVRHSLTREA
jgi:hypothetical protein